MTTALVAPEDALSLLFAVVDAMLEERTWDSFDEFDVTDPGEDALGRWRSLWGVL